MCQIEFPLVAKYFQFITGRNEVVAKVLFLQVSVCPQGGRVSASVHVGMPNPPGPGRTPPGNRQKPTPRTPPGAGRPLREADSSIRSTTSAGTHPTGMHSCFHLKLHIKANNANFGVFRKNSIECEQFYLID